MKKVTLFLHKNTYHTVFGQLPPSKITSRLGLGFDLELGLELGLGGGNFPRGQLS